MPVSECWYERVDGDTVVATLKSRGPTKPLPRHLVNEPVTQQSACRTLCGLQVGAEEFEGGDRGGRSDEAKACLQSCTTSAQIYRQCDQVGWQWKTLAVPY